MNLNAIPLVPEAEPIPPASAAPASGFFFTGELGARCIRAGINREGLRAFLSAKQKRAIESLDDLKPSEANRLSELLGEIETGEKMFIETTHGWDFVAMGPSE